MLTLKNIDKIYNTGAISFKALDKVSLQVEEGDFVSIIGPSGSGKSTMMNILGCLDRATSGTYMLDGQYVSEQTDSTISQFRNKKIGFVFQSFNLLPKLSTLENVELPMVYAGYDTKSRRQLAMTALEKVGLKGKEANKPTEISGGQKQRVAIARALAMNPGIILADEPTGNLDSKTTKEIMDIFSTLNAEGHTIVMITHEPEIAELTNRVVTINDGQITNDTRLRPIAKPKKGLSA